MKRFIENNADIIGRIVILILILSFIVFLWITTPERTATDEAYSNGICTECAGAYKFSTAAGVRNGRIWYFYSCENCGYTIKTLYFHN